MLAYFLHEPETLCAADFVAHNIRILAEHVAEVKARILEMEGCMAKTANGRLVIEARWRETLDWLVDEFGNSIHNSSLRSLTPPHCRLGANFAFCYFR